MSNPSAFAPIDLRDLRLDTALSLLEQGGVSALPTPAESPALYLQSVLDGLCEMSQRDPLTGLANRRQFRTVLEREIDRVARSGESALLLMMDIDHFKKVNDEHGHSAGDLVLQAVARTLSACVRPMDTTARYGGEEFAVVLPHCHAAYGQSVAERIRRTISETLIATGPHTHIQVTVSVGGAFALEWIRSTSLLWIDRADFQLYRAKTEGRNRVCMEAPPDSTVSAEEKSLLFGHLAAPNPAWLDAPALAAAAAAAPQNTPQ